VKEREPRRRRYLRAVSGLSPDEFEAVVHDALASLPPRFAEMVENVVITVEDEPSDEDLEVGGDDEEGSELLGIYRGVALTDRSYDAAPLLPDEIALFRGPINRIARTRAEAVHEVRETVIHELGHYFGLADDDMPH